MGCSPWGHKESDMTEAFTRNGTYAHGPLLGILWASPVAQTVKNPPASLELQETWVRSLDQEDPLEEGMATQNTPVFLPGKSHGQRRLAGCSPWSRKE